MSCFSEIINSGSWKLSLSKIQEGNEKLIDIETLSHNGVALCPSSSAYVLKQWTRFKQVKTEDFLAHKWLKNILNTSTGMNVKNNIKGNIHLERRKKEELL